MKKPVRTNETHHRVMVEKKLVAKLRLRYAKEQNSERHVDIVALVEMALEAYLGKRA